MYYFITIAVGYSDIQSIPSNTKGGGNNSLSLLLYMFLGTRKEVSVVAMMLYKVSLVMNGD